ncbi:MAG TPA: mechanosensitive ion channel [Candidatus Paraprevotella stercorigallinarum]|jgi:small conductance mechanosensitive channel|nr:mechanosensitive ion channel [Candidatus Paraprevotella stercorigallinarum]
MIHLLSAVTDSLSADTTNVAKEVVQAISSGKTDLIIEKLIEQSIEVGKNILAAVIVFIVGRFLISLLKRMMTSMMEKRKIEITIQTFLHSLVNILLNILLVIAVIGALGINTASFAALLASAGVAIGMALSGNLQNLAGGLIVLLFKPYKVGDWIEAQGVSGSVAEIQIMHTLLTTVDNKVVYVPNGAMSSGTIINYSRKETRRIEWIVGVDYGEDIDKVKNIIDTLIAADERILKEPAPYIALHALDSSSVNVTIRVWVPTAEYWNVYFDMNKKIYDEFNKQGVNFPFPQLTIHQS